MKAFIAFIALVSVASAEDLAPATPLVKTPSLDSDVIKGLGGNIAYTRLEGHPYAAVAPIVHHVDTPISFIYQTHPPVVTYKAQAPVVIHKAQDPVPVTTYKSQTPVVYKTQARAVYKAPAPVVTYEAPTPVVTYMAQAPVVTYADPALIGTGLYASHLAHPHAYSYGAYHPLHTKVLVA